MSVTDSGDLTLQAGRGTCDHCHRYATLDLGSVLPFDEGRFHEACHVSLTAKASNEAKVATLTRLEHLLRAA